MNQRLARRTAPLGKTDLAEPALVIAPHPDDETLGCGGLIATKRAIGAPVDVVFMTDGSASHARFMDRQALSAERRREAAAACSVLGVSGEHVHFLAFVDGRLADAFDDAVERLAEIIGSASATQLILPHPDEPERDHHAAHAIAEAALDLRAGAMDALLYPVWMWDQWPWTNPLSQPRARRGARQIVEVALRGRLGFRPLHEWTHHLDLGTVIDQKRAALDAHRTQTSSEDRPDGWLTLGDVADGDWLAQLLGEREYFAKRRVGRMASTPRAVRARARR
jgi:LmbE family N-acetylglucosaminyl deacetylase